MEPLSEREVLTDSVSELFMEVDVSVDNESLVEFVTEFSVDVESISETTVLVESVSEVFIEVDVSLDTEVLVESVNET